jgi:copper chaperone CopZ
MKYMLMVFSLAGALLMSGCRVSDIRELTVQVPGMAAESDVQRIRQALAPLNGVNKEQAVYNVTNRTIKVTFDSMVVANKNIEIAIAEAGYEANGIAAIVAPANKPAAGK